MTIRNEFDLPQEVFDIILKQAEHFNPVGVKHLLRENGKRKYGQKELLVFFKEDQIQVMGESDLKIYENSDFIKIRASLIVSIVNKYIELYPWIKDRLYLIVPISFSDTADTQLQEIPCLTFSKRAYSNNILIPSVNNLIGYTADPQVNAFDTPLLSKQDKLCFVGSFTDTELKESARIKIAQMAAADPDRFFCRIIRPPKFDIGAYEKIYYATKATFPDSADDILVNEETKIGLDKQLPYKFQLTIDGITCAWARLPWQMRANCVPIKIRNRLYDWQEWFYPLLDPSSHFLEVDIDDLVETHEYLKSNVREQIRIDNCGKNFVAKYLSQDIAEKYLIQMLLILSSKFKGIQ